MELHVHEGINICMYMYVGVTCTVITGKTLEEQPLSRYYSAIPQKNSTTCIAHQSDP